MVTGAITAVANHYEKVIERLTREVAKQMYKYDSWKSIEYIGSEIKRGAVKPFSVCTDANAQ